MSYVDWLRDQLRLIDPEGDRTVVYEPGHGYRTVKGVGAVNGGGAKRGVETVLRLDHKKRMEILLDEVAGFAARGRVWRGRDECTLDEWRVQASHFAKHVARVMSKAIEQHGQGTVRAVVTYRDQSLEPRTQTLGRDAHSAA